MGPETTVRLRGQERKCEKKGSDTAVSALQLRRLLKWVASQGVLEHS